MTGKSEQSVLDRISMNYPTLFEAEKRVADFVLSHPSEVIDMTVADLALASGASEATVIRFCKRCGSTGFHQLKIDMARETVPDAKQEITNELRKGSLAPSIQNILENKLEELRQTLLGVDMKTCETVLSLLQNARVVVLAAVGNTIPIALDGAYKFNELGITAISSIIWENLLATLHTLKPQDVVLALSASGESKHILQMADCAIEHRIPVIAITNHVNSTLAQKSTYVLRSVSRERLLFRNNSFLSTRLSMMAMIEMLYFLLCNRKEDSFRYIDAHESSIAGEKV